MSGPLKLYPNLFELILLKVRFHFSQTWKFFLFKDALSGLRPFLVTETPLKMMKNAFYFTLKALFVLKVFKFLSCLFDHVGKRVD